jgi:hypothetical protein
MVLGIDLEHLVLDQLMLQRLNQRQHEQLNLLPLLLVHMLTLLLVLLLNQQNQLMNQLHQLLMLALSCSHPGRSREMLAESGWLLPSGVYRIRVLVSIH